VKVDARPMALLAASILAAGAAGAALFVVSRDVPPRLAIEQLARIGVAHVGSVVYGSDLTTSIERTVHYRIGAWDRPVPEFVFERHDSPHLTAFRQRYGLDSLLGGASNEYDAQLRLAAWVGSRFEHGTDSVPGGNHVCSPTDVVQAGAAGAAYWCEIAARLMVQAATAVGIPARVITASRDAYTWEHAVAELWSNQFNKWFVVDTDFNVVFEADGRPLSAWELVHRGPELQRNGRLLVRRFAKFKEGLVPQDLLRFFAYVHLDKRTDWCTRKLRRGSPAGGDLATVWTARPGSEPPLTAIPRARGSEAFDWPVNVTAITLSPDGRTVRLGTWSPVFAEFEYRLDEGPWTTAAHTEIVLSHTSRPERIEARVRTIRNDTGPVASLTTPRP